MDSDRGISGGPFDLTVMCPSNEVDSGGCAYTLVIESAVMATFGWLDGGKGPHVMVIKLHRRKLLPLQRSLPGYPVTTISTHKSIHKGVVRRRRAPFLSSSQRRVGSRRSMPKYPGRVLDPRTLQSEETFEDWASGAAELLCQDDFDLLFRLTMSDQRCLLCQDQIA